MTRHRRPAPPQCNPLLATWIVVTLTACAGPQKTSGPRSPTQSTSDPGQPATADASARANTAAVMPDGGFRSPEGQDHPLAGAILRTTDGERVDWHTLLVESGQARAVLLGEKHDNPDHHLLQAKVFRALTRAGKTPGAVFEMLDANRQPDVSAVVRSPASRPTDVATAVQWEQTGWPAFELYAPVFQAVIDAGVPVLAAGLPRGQAMALARGQTLGAVGAFDDQLEARYGLTQPLPPAQQTRMRELMQEAHCGMLPEAMLDGMVRIQRLRDALLAEGLRLAIEQQGSAVLFAGGGHVRKDGAVPALLERVAIPDSIAIAFREVTPEQTRVDQALDADLRAGFDFVVLTPALPAEDHCAELRRRFKKHDSE